MIRTDHLHHRKQVFVSSTYLDLKKERDEVRRALNKSNYIVEGMELFPAANKRQWDVIKERIDKSDLYVLIIASRFGSIAPFIKEVQRSDLTTAYWSSSAVLVSEVLGGLLAAAADGGTNVERGWIRADSLTTPVDPGHAAVTLVSKTHYIKFISYSQKVAGAPSLYRKFIHRLGREFEVWDEYNTVTVTRFSHCVSRLKFYTRTDGDAVDFSVLHPYVDKLTFSDVKAGHHDNTIHPVINVPSNIYATAASYLNGFQDGNTDLAMRATDYPAQSLRMTADFSSIPGHQMRFHLKRAVLVDPDEQLTDVSSLVQVVQPGVFTAECLNVAKDHVLRFDFDVQ